MKPTKTLLLQWLITLIPVIYYLSLWNQLPAEVPTHYDFNMRPDDYHSKGFMLGVLIFMGIVVVGSSAMVLNSNFIDPKREMESANPIMKTTSWAVTIFISVIMFFIVIMTKNFCIQQPIESFEKTILIVLCLFFICLGYLMKNVKPNYFFGIRTPWTLASDEVWRKTHLLSSKIWIIGSLSICLALLLCPENYCRSLFLSGVFFLVAIPVVYSYRLSKKLIE